MFQNSYQSLIRPGQLAGAERTGCFDKSPTERRPGQGPTSDQCWTVARALRPAADCLCFDTIRMVSI